MGAQRHPFAMRFLPAVLSLLFVLSPAYAAKIKATWETPEAEVLYKVTRDTGRKFEADVVITNKTSRALADWKVTFDLDREITSIRGASIVSHSGSTYRIEAGSNVRKRTIPARDNIRFSLSGVPGNITAPPTGLSILFGSATPGFSIADASVVEPGSGTMTVQIEVTLSPASSSATGVSFQTADGSAVAGSDYTPASGNLIFEPGAVKKTFPVTILADSTAEGTETFLAQLTAASGAEISRGTATVTIAPPVSMSPRVPFGSRPVAYTAGTLKPSASATAMDQAIVAYYNKWKSAYLVSVGSMGWKAVRSPDADHPFVAEAQGFGLEILALMAGADPDARSHFDAVLKYVLAHPSKINAGLMAAEQNTSGVSVNGSDSATDGDLAIAYALLLADKQWGSAGSYNYRNLALSRIAAIKQSEINPTTKLPLLGDWATPGESYHFGTRPSDFMVDHFRAFRSATGDVFWDGVISAVQSLITHIEANYSPDTGLVPDFIVATNTANPRPAPANYLEGKNDGAYSWNATRVPWRIGTDGAVHGDATSRAQSRKMSEWIRSASQGNPDRIKTGYTLAGASLGNGPEPAFVSTVAPAATQGTDQAWLDAFWTFMAAEAGRSGIDDYYGASLLLQSMIVASGNYWSPALVP